MVKITNAKFVLKQLGISVCSLPEPEAAAEQGKENCAASKVSLVADKQPDGSTGHCRTGEMFCL